MVTKKIKEIMALGLPVDWIMPGHGMIWRDNPLQIMNKYLEWADDSQENQVTILYDTMWNSTRDMAEAIARDIRNSPCTQPVSKENPEDRARSSGFSG
ncbi:MAG: hypothetical protein WC124_05770 [Desulfoplanes sp.]